MKSAHIATADRPVKGVVAFVPGLPMTAAMQSFGGCTSALHLSLRTGFQWLERNEDQVHP